MTYGILAIGVLFDAGAVHARWPCVAGAVFLLSVVMMQPFWVSEAQPTFNQYVEMFALLTLATTPVGRWAGLDFFLSTIVSADLFARRKARPMNLSPEEKAVGKENFQNAIGVTRRDFLKTGIAAGAVSGAGLGAMYFGYETPSAIRCASASSAPATKATC